MPIAGVIQNFSKIEHVSCIKKLGISPFSNRTRDVLAVLAFFHSRLVILHVCKHAMQEVGPLDRGVLY